MKTLLRMLTFGALLFAPLGIVTAQPSNLCGTKPCIQVGTFNIEWFGTTDLGKHAHQIGRAHV